MSVLHKVCIKSHKIQGVTSDSPCASTSWGRISEGRCESFIGFKGTAGAEGARGCLCHQLARCDLERSLQLLCAGIALTFPTDLRLFVVLVIKAHPNYRSDQCKHALLLSNRVADSSNCLSLSRDQNTLPAVRRHH